MAIDTAQRAALEKLLKDNIARLRGEISSALRATGSPQAVGLANHMENVDDQAVADLQTGVEIAGVERDLGELRDSLAALARMRSPDFGLCLDCRADIGWPRLQAQPSALRCIACQQKFEAGQRPASL